LFILIGNRLRTQLSESLSPFSDPIGSAYAHTHRVDSFGKDLDPSQGNLKKRYSV